MSTLSKTGTRKLWLLGALAAMLCSGACTQLHGEPQDGTETGNPPVATPSLNDTLVALVITADEVRVTGEPGAAGPAGATVEVISALTGEVFRGPVAEDGSFDVSVSASKLDSFEVRVTAAGEPSSSTVYVVPGAAAVTSASGGATLSCNQRESLALQQLEAVAAQAIKRCRIDSDCTTVSTNSQCNDSCSRYGVSNIDALEIDAAREAIEGGLCKTYKQDGCQFIAQPCAPVPGEVACIGGRTCALVAQDGPSCADKPVCVNGVRQVWPKVCEQAISDDLSAISSVVCIADDRGNVGLTTMTHSMAVTNKGWSSSKYGLVESTLSPDAQAKCDARLAALGADPASALQTCLAVTP
ncbi:MAG TPA: hypothetical protein VFZ61_00495 [Polyangiales bacterium]